jgi:hypothetical protein
MTKSMQAFAFRVITILATIATLLSGSMASVALARHSSGNATSPLAQDPSPSPAPSESPTPSPSPSPSVRMSVSANCANEYNNNVRAFIRIVVSNGSVTVDALNATLEGTSGGSVTYTPSNIVGRTLAPGTHDVQVLFRGYTLNAGVNDLRVNVSATFSGNQQSASSPYFENCQVGPSPTPSPSPSPSASPSPSPSPSDSPSPSPSPSASPSPSPSPSDSPSPSPSDVPSPSPSPSDVPSPSPSPSDVPSPSPSPSDVPSPSPSPSDVPSPSPSPSDVPSPSPSPSDVPSPSPSTPGSIGAPPSQQPPSQQPPSQQPPSQQPPSQQPPQTVGGVSDETADSPTRREAVAGASDDISEQPRAVLPATGMSELLTWLMLSMASLMIAIGSLLKSWKLSRS